MKRFAKHIILFLSPFVLAAVILFLIPVEKKFSYHFVKGECNNKASWIYHRIFENEKAIDIAFSGASQTGCAIMDKYLTEKISSFSDKEINAANLGYCRRGRDVQYVILKDLFEHKNPKYLIVEVAEDEPKKSHPVFPYLANSTDLFASLIVFNQRYLTSIWKGVVVRFEYLKYKLFKNTIESYEYSDFSYINTKQVVSETVIQRNKQTWEQRLAKEKPDYLRKIELNYSKHYLQKIAELANKNNCQLFFLYLPESGSQLPSPLLLDYYKKIAPIIILPQTITGNPKNWMDATHFNDAGAKEVSEILVREITSHK